MSRTTVVAFVLLTSACRSEGASSDAGGAAKETKAEPEAKVEAKSAGEAKVEPNPTGADAVADSGETPAAEPSNAEVWLVWSRGDGQTKTGWVEVADGKAKVVAEREDIVVSDGAKLWRLEESSKDIEYIACECMDLDEDEPELSPEDCKPSEQSRLPMLDAVPLSGGTPVKLVGDGVESPDYGSDADHGLSILGGVGTTLLVETSISGYFCGAHGLYESTWFAVDVATGKTRDIEMGKIGAGLPEAIQKEAAEEILPEVEACDDEPTPPTAASVMKEMTLGYASIELAGEPKISWIYDFPLPYVCSNDYAAHGMGITGPLEAAAPLGLGALAPGLKLALAGVKADHGGWAQITATGKARDDLLETFKGAGVSLKVADVDAGKLLSDARKATREGKYDDAIAALDRVLAADPENPRAWSTRGYAKVLAGDLDGAGDDLNKALEKKPDDDAFAAAVHFNLGMLAEKRSNPDAAKKAYAQSNALRPSKQAKAALDRLGK